MKLRSRVIAVATALATIWTVCAQSQQTFTFSYYNSYTKDGVDVSINSCSRQAIPCNLDHYYGTVLMDAYQGYRIPPGGDFSYATWLGAGVNPGYYCVYVTYASMESRPLSLQIDGAIVLSKQLGGKTEGWLYSDQTPFFMGGPIRLDKSPTFIKLIADSAVKESWPHFSSMTFMPTTAEAGCSHDVPNNPIP
jgi:hypothetical protein